LHSLRFNISSFGNYFRFSLTIDVLLKLRFVKLGHPSNLNYYVRNWHPSRYNLSSFEDYFIFSLVIYV